MRNLLVALVAIASVGLAAPPARAEPGWCKAAGERVDTPSPDDVLGATDPRWAVYYIVGALCFPDDGMKKAAGKIEEARQAWSKKLEMIDADWADAADWATHQQYERMGPTLYPANLTHPLKLRRGCHGARHAPQEPRQRRTSSARTSHPRMVGRHPNQ